MSEDRLDRIEKLVESNAKTILALAEQAKEDRQVSREANEQLQVRIREVAEGSLRTNDAVISLLSVIERQQSDIGALHEGIRSTNAAIERLDSILDRLVRRGDD